MTDHTTHDLALARAERDAWQSTCEELHRTIAGRDVEIESHLGRCEAADQRARSLDAALAHEREASKGLVAQVEALRKDLAHAQERLAERRTAQRGEVERLEAERDRLRAELAELRARPVLTEDLLRGALDAHGYAGLTRKLFAHLGPVTLPLAELRARPVLTVEALDAAAESCGYGSAVIPGFAAQMFAAIGPATLPSPDRAEELCLRYHDSTSTIGIARGPAWREYSDEGRAGRVSVMRKELTALANLSPAPAPTFDAAFLRRVLVATKHGPNGKGGPGPCDAACVKCEAELMAKAAPAREVAPTRVLVHADGGACHGSRVVDGRCVGCGIAPDMQSTSLWLDADARPVQCEPAKVVAPTLVAASDEELAVAFYSEPERPALRECIDAADLAGIRAVRAKLGAAEVTEERLAWAIGTACDVTIEEAERRAKAIFASLRATAAKGG